MEILAFSALLFSKNLVEEVACKLFHKHFSDATFYTSIPEKTKRMKGADKQESKREMLEKELETRN